LFIQIITIQTRSCLVLSEKSKVAQVDDIGGWDGSSNDWVLRNVDHVGGVVALDQSEQVAEVDDIGDWSSWSSC